MYNPIMDSLVAKKLEDFFSGHKQQVYRKGEILIRADDKPPGIFYLKEGTVKKYAISRKGDELIVNVFRPISFFPMSWAMNGTPNTYFYEAMTDLKVSRAPGEEVVEFVRSNPDVIYDLLSRVYRGTDGMTERMTYLMAGNAYARLVAELLIQAKRFGKVNQDSVELKISEKDIASLSGMTRETVSREMRILKDRKLAAYSKNILHIFNIKKLEHELADGV